MFLLRCPTSFTRLWAHQPTTAATTSTSATKEPPVQSAIRTHRGRRRFSVRVSWMWAGGGGGGPPSEPVLGGAGCGGVSVGKELPDRRVPADWAGASQKY